MINSVLYTIIYEYMDSMVIAHLSDTINREIRPTTKTIFEAIASKDIYNIGYAMNGFICSKDANSIACMASIYGYRNIVNKMIYMGATNYNDIACNAAKYGYLDIVNDMFNLGVYDINLIAYNAATGGHSYILYEMINRGANDWNDIASWCCIWRSYEIYYLI